MNLKNKIALTISSLFTVIYAISTSLIYLLFADFRKDEFESRLKEKASSTIKLLIEVNEIDKQVLKVIDKNSIHQLYDEKTLIFDSNFNLIYSSLDDTKIKLTQKDLEDLKVNRSFFRKDKEKEVYGFFFDTHAKDYYAVVSAHDSFGKRKLEYLIYILLTTYLILTAFTWFLTHLYIRRLLAPLDEFHKQIKSISENNLDSQVLVSKNVDEIDLLAIEFNAMLDRLHLFYKKQEEFTSNASHELRTPLFRLSAQLENKISEQVAQNADPTFNKMLLKDVNFLTELTHSLLLLSKLDNESTMPKEDARLDELIFESFDKVKKVYPDFAMNFDIEEVEDLDIQCNRDLVRIAFSNLMRNAYLYSTHKIVQVRIRMNGPFLSVLFSNDGETLTPEERERLFDPFFRGQNSRHLSGLGLGLRIVKRILMQYQAKITYFISEANENVFTITFEK